MARVWGVGLLVIALAACGGGDDSDESVTTTTRAATTVAAATTTLAPTSTTVATPVPTPDYSFDGSVPAPPLLNTGTDYVAIYESLRAYTRWLEAHNPDPDLLDEAVSQGTVQYTQSRENLENLQQEDLRGVWVGYAIEVEVKDADADSAALRITDHTTGARLIRPDGSIQDEAAVAAPTFDDVLIAADGTGRWRIVDISPVPSGDEVVEL